MKKIKTNNGEILVIKVPELSCYFDWRYSIHKTDKEELKIIIYWETKDDRVSGKLTDFTDSRKFEILGKLSDLKNKDLEEFIKFEDFNNDIEAWRGYKSYLKEDRCDIINSCCLDTPKESFKSLLKSNDIDWNENETLIIKIL